DMNHENDEQKIFKNQLNKFIDKSISSRLYKSLYDNSKFGWNLNIKILNESIIVNMIKSSLNTSSDNNNNNNENNVGGSQKFKIFFGNIVGKKFDNNDEIQILDRLEWIKR